MKDTDNKVWRWLPTLYIAESMPYVVINTLSVLMYTKLGVDLTTMAFWTGLLYLPWVLKPLWSPFVDIYSSRRRWVLAMQWCMAICFALSAWLLSLPSFFAATLIMFTIAAFSSATHDIAADGYYMLALTSHRQAECVGWRSTFYRVGMIFASGGLVWICGELEEMFALGRTPGIPEARSAWTVVLLITAGLLAIMAAYHKWGMPKPEADKVRSEKDASETLSALGNTFVTFFAKKGVLPAILFMLLYRLPEALCIKIIAPFLVDTRAHGGLALSTKDVGMANGVTGVIALLVGGILGGWCISRGGLKKWLWPMAMSLTLPCALYALLAVWQPQAQGLGLVWINVAIGLEQFGYGFGFTAFMLYLIYFSEGKWKTSHYAFCTAFMALGMMLPGMAAGVIMEWLASLNPFGLSGPQGYTNYFTFVVLCSIFTALACAIVKIDPKFGKKIS